MPGVRRQAVDGDSPPEVDTPKALEDVPVLFPGGADFEIVWPLEPGDPVRLEYSEEDDEPFYSTTSSAPVNPEVLRRHGGNVVCRPEGTRGIPSPFGKATFIGSDGTNVLLGANDASEYIALTEALISAIKNAVDSAATGSQDGGAAFKAALSLGLAAIDPASVSATKVRAK